MTAAPAGALGVAGWLRFVRRAVGLLVLLLGCLLLYAVAAPFSGRNPAPRLFLGGVLRVAGGRLRVAGQSVAAPSILLANHLSWLDIPALAGATGSAFVAHDGLAGHAVMRFLCDLNRTVFIARGDRSSVTGQVDQVRDGLQESGVLTLFPEGTTDDGRELLPFKSSLLAAVENSGADVAIRPVWIDYGALAADFAWFGDEPGLDNARRILARKGSFTVTVHLLAPLDAQQRQDRKTIARSARDAIVAVQQAQRAG